MDKNLNNNEITFIYPGSEVIRNNENSYNTRKPFNMQLRERDQEVNIITEGEKVFAEFVTYIPI